MPRRRTIFCDHCGYAQLKSDDTCDRCKRTTAWGKKRLAVSVGGVVAMLVAVAGAVFFIQSVVKGFGPGL